MKICIINPYGNVPGEGWREYRSTMIAEAFNSAGHSVVWFVANFEHRSKSFRSLGLSEIDINSLFKIVLLPSLAYKEHISLKRIRFERYYARQIIKFSKNSNFKPDLVILADPCLFYSDIVYKFIKKNHIPFILDILDLWPELFKIRFPLWMHKFIDILILPLYLRRDWIIRNADCVVGATSDYLEIGKKANPSFLNEVIYLGIDTRVSFNDSYKNTKLNGYIKHKNEFRIIYAGTLGINYDLVSILDSAKMCCQNYPNVTFYIAGDGPNKNYVIERINSDKLKNVFFLGVIDIEDLNLFYNTCDLGLLCYVNNSTVSMPVKAYDCIYSELPMLNSLKNEIFTFIESNQIGLNYEAGNSLSLTNKIIKIYNDPNLHKKMKNNIKNVKFTFDKIKQYKKFVNIAETLLSR